jgi:hypothetical protein
MTTMLMDDTQTLDTLTLARAPRVAPTVSRGCRWAGRILTGIPALFLLFDGVMKLVRPSFVVAGTVQLGYQPSVILGLGIVLSACLALYLIPRTAIVGAVLLTGYLGGAVASHVRVGDPLFSHVLFPIYLAVFLWGGLALRDRRVAGLLAPRVRA